MPTNFNPYAPPKTSVTHTLKEVVDSDVDLMGNEPFVAQNGFYCKPDFESSPICFLTGIRLPESLQPTELSTEASHRVLLYFDPAIIRSSSWQKRFTAFFLISLVFFICFIVFLLSNIVVTVLTGLILVFYVLPKPKGQITVHDAPHGFIRITGGHENFLSHYPRKNLPFDPPIEISNILHQ